MPVTIKIKRRAAGGATGAPSTLASGEIAFNEVAGDLNFYYGAGDNGSGQATSVLTIGGFGSAFDTNVRGYRLDQLAAPTTPLVIPTPTAPNHAATKGYIDTSVQSAAAGIVSKPSVRLVAVANTSLSGLSAVDGVTPVAGDRILLTAQTTASQNGVYVASSGTWSRATDADQTGEITPGSTWYVSEGSALSATTWRVSTTGTITIGTTAITIVQFGGQPTSYDGGTF